jgi:recombination protein RecA
MKALLPIRLSLPAIDDPDRAQPALPGAHPPTKETNDAPRRWDRDFLAGGIAEISAPRPAAGLTAATRLILQAQERGEPAAWIAAGDSLPYAPDLHDAGVDLEALPLVCVSGSLAAARAAEHLLRSGSYGLIVLDLGRASTAAPNKNNALSSATQVRLAALCRRHQAALLLLARRAEGMPAIASLAFLRAEGAVRRKSFDQFTVQLQVLKDKHRGRLWSHEEIFRGPDGLC